MKSAKKLLLLAAALGATGLISCSIPKPECTVGQSGFLGGLSGNDYLAFAVRYVPKDNNPNSCPVMTGELVGMQSYHPAKEGDEQNRDFSKTSIAIRTQSSGELYWMIEDFFGGDVARAETPNAEGPFVAADPDASDFCQVTEAESRVNFAGTTLPLVDPGCTSNDECPEATGVATSTCELIDAANEVRACSVVYAPTDLGYKWSNIQVYVTAATPGTQFTADVQITINGCSAEYTAVGMWPAVDCTDYYREEPTFLPDDLLCDPEPDPEGLRSVDAVNGSMKRAVGSGISPDFGPVKCDATINVIPVVDQYYTELVTGGPVSVPRCALTKNEIPALEGYKAPAGGEGGAGGGG